MQVTVITEDNNIIVDGDERTCEFTLPSNIWAIQWNGTSGEIEYNDGTPNESINNFNEYQYLIDLHTTTKEQQQQKVADAEVNAPYWVKRAKEYPPVEMYLDAVVKGDDIQIAEYIARCKEVKDKYPKETV